MFALGVSDFWPLTSRGNGLSRLQTKGRSPGDLRRFHSQHTAVVLMMSPLFSKPILETDAHNLTNKVHREKPITARSVHWRPFDTHFHANALKRCIFDLLT